MLEKTLRSPLDCKEIKSVNPKGNQPWIFIGRTVAEAKAPILWPPDVKSQLIRKDPDAGEDCRQKEKRVAEDEMVREHHQLNGHELHKPQETVEDREAWHAVVHEVTKSQTQLNDWTTTKATFKFLALSLKDRLLLGYSEEMTPYAHINVFFFNKVLLKYKRDRESFWHRHQKGAERIPPHQCFNRTATLKWSRDQRSKSLNLFSFPVGWQHLCSCAPP